MIEDSPEYDFVKKWTARLLEQNPDFFSELCARIKQMNAPNSFPSQPKLIWVADILRERIAERWGRFDSCVTMPNFAPRAKKMIALAIKEACALGHSFVSLEHLLLGFFVQEGIGIDLLSELLTCPRNK